MPAREPGADGLPGVLRPRAATESYLPIADLPPVRTFRYPRRPDETGAGPGPWAPAAAGGAPEAAARTETDAGPEAGDARGDSPWAWCRVLGQVGDLYVVLETEDGFVLMDPHAAHERVLFERFMRDVESGALKSQALLLPETVELQPRDALRVRENLDVLKALGFGISEFGGDVFVVDAVPGYFGGASPFQFLVDLVAGLERAGSRGGHGRWREESIAQAACKAAVKARDKLTLEEIEQLVIDLSRTEMPYTCPHGRPTVIYTSFRELNRKFGRE
jgi:DNA mismatch repair protein MutL